MNKRSLYGYSEEEYRRFKQYSWRYLLLFATLYCTLYCTRQNLTVGSAMLIRSLNMTKGQIGALSTSLFWMYGLGQFVHGRLSDQFGAEKFVVLSVVGSVAMNYLITLRSAFVYMVVIWGLNGLLQSMAWAPGISMLARWWPKDRHGFATGFTQAASGFGQALASLTVSWALVAFPSLEWKAVFFIPSVVPVLALILYLSFCKTAPSQVGLKDFQEGNSEPAHAQESATDTGNWFGLYRHVLSNRIFLIWCFIIFFIGIARFGLSTWIPLYFVERYRFSITEGILGSLTLPLGMGIGTIVVPSLTDKYCAENRLTAAAISSMIAGISIFGIYYLNPTIEWQLIVTEILLFIAGFCIFAISGTSSSYAADVGGRVYTGTTSGLLSFFAYMGAGLQAAVYGFILDRSSWKVVFLSISLICLFVSFVAMSSIAKKD